MCLDHPASGVTDHRITVFMFHPLVLVGQLHNLLELNQVITVIDGLFHRHTMCHEFNQCCLQYGQVIVCPACFLHIVPAPFHTTVKVNPQIIVHVFLIDFRYAVQGKSYEALVSAAT